jgi:hypothetical protein
MIFFTAIPREGAMATYSSFVAARLALIIWYESESKVCAFINRP